VADVQNILRLLTTLGICVAIAAACSRPVQTGNGQPTGPTRIRVVNQGFPDMNIYVISSGGERVRLGTSTGNTTMTFNIPDYLVANGASIRFLADPIGGTRAPVSNEISVQPGETVELTIPPS
jgi:hypothetical protein